MIPGIAAAIIPVVSDVIDRFFPNKSEAAKVKAEMEVKLIEAANQINLGQIEVNKAEAQHRSLFVAGWRPAIGWACAVGFIWAFVGQPIAEWVLYLSDETIILPDLQVDNLMEMAFGMLGLAGLRSWEKSRGLAR
jgi:hypothetical protein